jgi:protein-L-isoaspartate(D-aspartate) O-methyltransferase
MNSRKRMVDHIRTHYGLDSPKVLNVMLEILREKFVSKIYKSIAYSDGAISVGHGQTMSQPYTVAFMTHLLTEKRDTRNEKVLEIGTGSGYQAAVLSRLVKEVYTIEVIDKLARKARKLLKSLKYFNVKVKIGDGAKGWPEKAPFDAIIITAGVEKVPKTLFEQLKVGGVLVAPVGKGYDKRMTKYKKLPQNHSIRGRQNSKNPKFQMEKYDVFHFVPFVES